MQDSLLKIEYIVIPHLGVNDEHAELTEWDVEEGQQVVVGESLCSLETTKASYDIEASSNGYVSLLAEEGEDVLVNQSVAVISDTYDQAVKCKEKILKDRVVSKENDSLKKETGIKATKKAIDLASKYKIDIETVKPSQGGIVRESDVMSAIHSNQSPGGDNLEVVDCEGKDPVAVYGAGRGAIILRETLELGEQYKVACFVSDNLENTEHIDGIPVLHSDQLEEIYQRGVQCMAIAIAGGNLRLQKMKNAEHIGFEIINSVHPQAYLSSTVRMGKGNHIKAGALIDTNTVIGDCCIVDNGVVIAHDNQIGDGCHLAPGAVFGSSIVVGKNTVVGIGVSVSTGINIGKNSIVSVGTSVTNNVKECSVIEGVPGKVIGKTNY